MTSNETGCLTENKKMTKGPKPPHRLKWGDRTAAKADGAGYLTGIGAVGCTSLKDVIIVEVHESAADGAGAWSAPEGLHGAGSGDVFMEKPGAGAHYRYTKLKNIVYEES